jgi:hypothetical protein
MKIFRVRQWYTARGWTTVKCETEEEAIRLIELGLGYFEDDDSHGFDTNWETLEEV